MSKIDFGKSRIESNFILEKTDIISIERPKSDYIRSEREYLQKTKGTHRSVGSSLEKKLENKNNQYCSTPSQLDWFHSKASNGHFDSSNKRVTSFSSFLGPTLSSSSSSYVTAPLDQELRLSKSISSNTTISNSLYLSAKSELGEVSSDKHLRNSIDFDTTLKDISAATSTQTLYNEDMKISEDLMVDQIQPEIQSELAMMETTDSAELIENLTIEQNEDYEHLNDSSMSPKSQETESQSQSYIDNESSLMYDMDDEQSETLRKNNASYGRRLSDTSLLTRLIQPASSSRLARKNSIQMIESEKLPSVTEGVAMREPCGQLEMMSDDLRSSQTVARPSSLRDLMVNNPKTVARFSGSIESSSRDNVSTTTRTNSSNSLDRSSNSPPTASNSSNRRRRSSTTSQSSSVLSETSRNQLNFDLSPDLPPDSNILETNALIMGLEPQSVDEMIRPESPEPGDELEHLEHLRDSPIQPKIATEMATPDTVDLPDQTSDNFSSGSTKTNRNMMRDSPSKSRTQLGPYGSSRSSPCPSNLSLGQQSVRSSHSAGNQIRAKSRISENVGKSFG